MEVKAPPQAVYDYVADLSKHPEWAMDDMVIKAETPGPAQVGSRYQAEGTLFGRRNPSTVTVTALDPPRRLELEAQDGQGITGHVFTFEPAGDGTLVTRQIYGVKQPWFGPILLLVFGGSVAKNFNGALSKLKQHFEA